MENTKITRFDRETLTDLRADIDAALEPVAEFYGVTFKLGRIGFMAHNAHGTLEMALPAGGDGPVMTKEVSDFVAYAPMWGMAATDLGRTFVYGGTTAKIIGARPRSRSPILVETELGRRYKFPVDAVRNLLAAAVLEGMPPRKQKAQSESVRARQVERMESDPEYAAKVRASQKAQYEKMRQRKAEDPDYAAQLRARDAERRARAAHVSPEEQLAKLKEQEAALMERIRLLQEELEERLDEELAKK